MVLRREDELQLEGLDIGIMDIKDERFGDRIFHGTAKDVYEEMKSLKPELFTEEIEEDSQGTSLVRRQAVRKYRRTIDEKDRVLTSFTTVQLQLQHSGQQVVRLH